MQAQEMTPTPDRPLLVGLLVDVSGSMMSSIQNAAGGSLNRLESFERALGEIAAKAKEATVQGHRGLIKVFAYGFGFGNLLTSFRPGGGGPEVRDILRRPFEPEAAIDLDGLADHWEEYRAHVRSQTPEMFGGTPMERGFEEVTQRFERERQRGTYVDVAVLFVLSDGLPDSKDLSSIVDLSNRLKGRSVEIVSCYVTDSNITEPRHVYGNPMASWPAGAKLMFDVASELPRNSPFEAYMVERRWTLEEHGKLFTQVNQSEILAEFLSLVISPIENRDRLVPPSMDRRENVAGEGSPRASVESKAIEDQHLSRRDVPGGHMAVDENRIYVLIANWTFVTALLIGVIGVILILAGSAAGETDFSLFGQTFKSTNVGIGALFIAVVMVVLNIRRLFTSVDRKRH